MLRLVLPYPPSVNHYYMSTRRGVILGKRGMEYRSLVDAAVREATAGRNVKFEGGVFLRIDVWPPDCRRRDLDNILKAVQDAVTHAGLWADDSQISELYVLRKRPYKCPRRKGRETQGIPGGALVLYVDKADENGGFFAEELS